MCGRLACSLCPEDIPKACGIVDRNGKEVEPKWVDDSQYVYKPFYNGAPTTTVPVVIYDSKKCNLENENYFLAAMKWRYTPSSTINPQLLAHTHNARIENIVTSNMYKNSLTSKGRCIVVAEGFYEWQTTSGAGNKQPYFIYQQPNQCALTERKYTYDDIMVKATNFSKYLRKKLKVQQGDTVAVLLPNIPEFYICVFGSMLAGAKVTTINPLYTSGEIQRQLLDADVKVLATLTLFWQNAKSAVDASKKNINVVTIKSQASEATPGGAIDFQELANSRIDIPDIELPSADKTVFIPYSSGTTGLPKGVELSSNNLVANVIQVTHPQFKLVEPEGDQAVSIAILPLFHVYGFTTTLTLMKDGAKIVTLPKFTPDSYIGSLKNYKPHILMLVPPMVMFLYSHPGIKNEYLSSLRSVTSGAAPLGALDEEKLRQKFGSHLNILQGYGLSETSPAVTFVPLGMQGQFPGSMGALVPNTQIKVVDPNDKDANHLGVNQTGELLVKGPQVMKGYLNKPQETVDAFVDGWLRTGDLVHCNDDGMVYIADRIKELIKVKGFQVPPAELEEIIRDFPGVAEAAVVGIPHERYGEVPRAYVIPKMNSTVNVELLQEHVTSKVAKHKTLQGGVSVVESIPKTASGKILRKELKRLYEQKGI